MGELRNCPNCGKVFVVVKRNLCPACIQEEEEKFEEVRLYLKKNPGANIEAIAEEFDIEEKVVFRWIREGRIDVAGSNMDLKCQRCGEPIHIGSLCSKCAKLLTAQMMDKTNKQVEQAPKKDEGEEAEKRKRRMYVIDRFK